MSDVAKVADRIRKLLGLATSSNVNEAAAAAARAQKLMQEHKLSMADVSVEDGSSITELPLGSEGYMASWKFALVTGVARAFFCEVIALRIRNRRKIRVVGKKDDAEVAIGVFNYVVKEIDKLADEDVETDTALHYISSGRIDVRGYKEKFRQGAAAGVASKLRQQTAIFTSSSEKALVVVNRSKDELRSYLKVKYGESKQPEQKAPEGDAAEEAYLRGYERGEDINIPRTGGTERYLTGEVIKPKRPAPSANDVVLGDLFAQLLADMLSEGEFDDEEGDEEPDLSRGRGGRGVFDPYGNK
jgi:hypothetical protein